MDASRVFIIAEAGINHCGSIRVAEQLIHQAAHAGADAVKFQCFDAAELAGLGTPRYEMLKPCELPLEEMLPLQTRAKRLGLEFLATPFDLRALDYLVKIGVPKIKVSSADLTNLPFLKAVAATGLPVILSTGMAWPYEITTAVRVVEPSPITLLHCVSRYPTYPEELNLRVIPRLGQRYGYPVGLSDHSLGLYAPIAAVALGASVIEKHLTLDRTLPGPDHCASLEPQEFTAMVTAIRQTEAALGTGEKCPTLRELVLAKSVKRVVPL